MFKHFFLFELKLRFRSVSTYVFFLIPFLMALFTVSVRDFGPIGTGKVLLNGPYALTEIFVQLTAFGAILFSAIFGPAILRDFQQDTYQILFTKPISKFAYLGGRWAGSFVITVLIFSGLMWGAMAGTLMPWADRTRLAPVHFWWHLQPFLSVTVVQIFFLGSLFFCVAALSRRIVVVYLQGVALFALYLIQLVSVITANKLDRFWPSVFDSLGILVIGSTTRYWTVADRNAQLVHWTGAFLYNRLLWIGVGLVSLAAVMVLFPMSAEVLGSRRSTKHALAAKEEEEAEKKQRRMHWAELPYVKQIFGARTTWTQLKSLTWLRFLNIVKEVPFWAITLIMIVFVLINGHFAGNTNGVEVWPVTYLMLEAVSGQAGLFLIIIGALYAGEVIWRERDVRFDQIHESLPLRDWTDFASKFFALALVEALLIAVVMVCGVFSQAITGYFHFELLHYFKELYLVYWPQILMVLLLALFLQTVIGNKFVGHALVIGFFILIPVLYRYGIENRLYLFGEITPYTYSDMNGYGHFVQGLLWSITYWLWIGALLGVISIAFARRGTDQTLGWRMKVAGARMRQLWPAALVFAVLAAATGGWFYYNTHVLNEYRTTKESRDRLADYEKLYKKYERLLQPKVTAVDVAVDIFPERRSFSGTGSYVLENRSSQPIEDVHITDARDSIDSITFDRSAKAVLMDKKHFYSIYKLDQPLQPGESMKMSFRVSHRSRGFKDGNELPEFAYNGTFFDRDYFPFIGYNQGMEIDDPVRRKEEKLGPLEEMAPRGDPYYSNVDLFTSDSGWVKFHATVSTAADQIAVAPGYLQKEWTANGRRYFEYDMGDTPIADFFSFISGKFAVRRDNWKNVKLEIYYNPGHQYDLDKMILACKDGLDYYGREYGPYQFQQFRVLEYPRYRQFAQSFPNTVPYAESMGFIERLKKKDDIDFLYFVTAHELAHQWWGHQLIGSATQGSNMMSETLAEYSAMKLLEHRYGIDMLRKNLKYELDRYLRGRSGEVRQEPPLALVQREPYVWYYKGALVMYAMSDYIGEEKLNGALRDFLQKNRYAQGPYPDTRGFVEAIRAATPAELQYMVTDMFDSIVLYENKAVSATYEQTPDHKYRVTLKVRVQKHKADGQGNETPMPLKDLIEVGVFSGTKEHLKELHLEKKWFTLELNTLEFVVDEKPTFAGIDPYNVLIDREPDDNLTDVEKR